MELRIYLEFNQILKLIRKLPKEEIQRLITTLQSENELPRRKRTEYQPQKAKARYAASGRGINPKEIKQGKNKGDKHQIGATLIRCLKKPYF